MVIVTNKATGSSSTVAGNNIILSSPSVVKLSLSPRAIADYQKIGDDLVIRLHNGETIRIVHFYAHYPNGDDNDLVLQDEDGKLWVGQHGDGLADFNFAEIQSVDQLMGGATGGVSPVLLGLLGLGAVGGIIAAASSSDNDDDNDNGAGVDREPPAEPAVALENDTGLPDDGITGDGTVVVSNLEEGATWQYSTDGGKTWHDGSGASFELQPGVYGDGDILVRQIDSAGNIGPATSLGPVNVDVTAPTTDVAITDPEGDNIPTASGTTEPGSTVVVTWPDGTTSQVTADGTTGAWTATAPAEQPDGNVTVAVTDPAGNPGTGSGTWTSSDTTPPDTSATTVTVGAIAGDGVVNAAEAAGNVAVTVTITNPPSDAATTTVNVLVDGVPYAAVSNGDGTWTASVPGSALAGAATPTVTAEVVFADAAGNDAAPVTGTQTYTVDVTPPTTDVAITDPEGDNIPTASGTTEPGSTVVVTWPDGTTSQVTADGTTGAWTATAPAEQPDGNVTVAVTDPAGNPGTGSGTWTSSDTTPPDTSATTVTVGAIAGDGVVNAAEAAGNVAVTVTIANPPSDAATTTVNVLVDGVPYAAVSNGDGTWTASVPGSALAGAATPTVTAEVVFADAAGNDAAPVTGTQTYTVDVTPPTTDVAITDPEGDNIPTASGTTEPGSTVVVTWPDGTTSQVTADGTTGAWTATAPAEQPDGNVTVAVTDPAGNPGTGSGTWTSSDTTPPDTSATTVTVGAIAGDGVVNAAEAAGNVAVTVTIANPPSDAATTTVNVLVDGVPYAAVSNGDGTWTASVPGSALAGAATPTVTAEVVFADAAGNDAAPVTGTQTYTVDVTPPTTDVAITDPEGDNIPTASGTTEPGSTVVVTWPDGTTTQVTADGTTGAWTATAPVEQPDGNVTVAVTDPAGNPGTGSGTWTSSDTTPPDTSATTVTVGAIAGDGVVNAAEAAGNVAVTVTIANPPSDAATTTVNVLVDGVPYAAVSNGDGTWTASVPGSALAGAATPTVTAEVVFADAAGNDAAPVTGTQTYTVDVTPPTTDVAITDPEGDNIPTASGTTEPGSTVVVTWPDGTTSQVTADGTTGAWTATAPAEQPDGNVTVAVTDPAGNPGTGSGTWTSSDTTPPDTSATTVTVGAIAGDGVVNAAEAAGNVAVTVTITNPPSDAATTTVNVLVDGVPYAAVSNGDGTWTASVPGSALAGAATPTVTAEVVFADAAGNDAAPVTGTQTYTVDVTPPTTDVAITDPEGDNIPTASGTTEPGSTVVVTWPDGTTSQVTADGTTGAWTATAPAEQPDGNVTVAVTDPAGNPGTGSGTWTSSDTTPPDTSATTVTVGAIAGDGVVNAAEAAGNVAVTVTIANPPSDAATTTVNVLVDGVPYAAVSNGDGTWTASVPGSALAGAATPTVTAEVVFADAAGNDAAPVTGTQTYTVDVTPPTTDVAITDPEGDNIPTASGTTEPGSTVVVTWPDGTTSQVTADGTTGAWTATAPVEQPDGNVTVAVTDPAGNPGTGSGTWTSSDTTPPDTSATTVTVGAIAGDGVVNAAEAAGNVAVTVTITNPPSDAATTTVNVLVDGVPYAAVSNGDGTWTASVPGSALAGAATPTVTAEVVFADAAGNDAAPVTGTQTYTVDVTPPTTDVAITDPEGDNIPTASGTTEPGSTVVVTWPDGTTSQVTADGTTGAWTATAVLAQPAGTVSVAVTDPAGNPGSGSGGWTPSTTTPGAADDLAAASVDVVPTETAVDNGDATYLLGIGIGLGIIDLQATVLGVPSVGFTITEGHTQDLTFAFGGLANVGVLGDYQVVVQKWDALTGQWTSVDGSATGGSILNIGLLDGGANGVVIPDMDAGQYRAFMVYNGVGLSVLTTMTVSGLDHDYINTSIVTGEATGNVLDNDGGAAAAGHIVTSVNFNGTDYPVAAGPAGTTIIGQYGQLVIHQDGSYTYTPNADGTAIGKVDQFTYTLHDPVANTNTQAILYVRIDSDGQGLVWNDADLGADATYSVAATNDATEIDITWINPTDTAYFDQAQPLIGALGTVTANSNQFTIGSNMDATGSVVVSVTAAALASGTVTIQKLVGSVWQDVNTDNAFNVAVGVLGNVKTIDIGSLDLDAGTYRVHTTLSGALAAISVTTDVNVTHLDQHVISGDPSISGSLVANDGVVPEGSRVVVSDGGTFVDASAAGTVIHGVHGDLTVYSNGTYKYEPLDTLAYADREGTDSFTYKIVLPGGYETTAELVVQLHDGAAVTFTTETADPVSAESFSADTSGDVVALGGLAGSDASDSSPEPAQHNLSEALLLDDGGGEIVLPSSDSETGGGSSADAAVSSTDTDLITVDEGSTVIDPLAYLTPDPLRQEDPPHSAHMV